MIYDYKCTKCSATISVERSIHEEASTPMCFDCHESMDRVWSTPGIQFKGGGFYYNGG